MAQLWLQLFSSCSFCVPIDVGRWQEGFAERIKPHVFPKGPDLSSSLLFLLQSSILSHASLKNGLAAKARMFPLLGSFSIEKEKMFPLWHLKLMVWWTIFRYPPISQRFCRRMAFGRAANSSPIPAPKLVLQGWPPSNPGFNLLRAVVYLSHSIYGFDTSQIQNCSHQQKHDITWT